MTSPSTDAGELLALADLRAANIARQQEWDVLGQLTLAYRGNELAGEVGEACNVIKKLERERLGINGSRDTVAHLAEELADVIICTDLIAMQCGVDLGAAIVAKFNASSEKVGLKTRLAATAPAQAGEVVAWRYRFITTRDGKHWSDWFIVDERESIPERPADHQIIEPLYASPVPASLPSEEEIARIIVGDIYRLLDETIGPATLAARQNGLSKARAVLALLRAQAPARSDDDAVRREQTALRWEGAVEPLCEAVQKGIEPVVRKAADSLYDDIMTSVQDYLRDNVNYNLNSELEVQRYTIRRQREELAKLTAALEHIRDFSTPCTAKDQK